MNALWGRVGAGRPYCYLGIALRVRLYAIGGLLTACFFTCHNREIADVLAGDRGDTVSTHLHAGEDGDDGPASGSRLLTEYRYALLEAFEDVFDLKLQVRG